MLFNIMVSNSDDHLRNHGFIFDTTGWRLSPAYDINPTPNATGLHLNIDDRDNALEINLAFEVVDYFQLTTSMANEIYQNVASAVSQWERLATKAGISRGERVLMEDCFLIPEG